MFRFTIRDVLWLMVVVGLACLTISLARQLSALGASVKDLNAQTAAQRQEIHDLKERELALIRAVEQKYGGRIAEWKVWRDPNRPSQWRAELESEP
jgi:cell division protein FtsB